ncbi:hypothetical protein MTBPR1_100172 [Candidatus Terasakiella magnetica]|uniref:DUF2249 domain-containing protein n=1 Tax=Candidatus Terasakiella magnetica TaxID=1867952 RepID=A0A1C3RE67_9PROT|nr:DUF2249 domain-containing protein [Candidatus Terasakiella magnetica]SCA55531.1 hypothetical protein MTBPR1_100172 [Candidatus Terasakiella magnetica]
MTIKANNNYPCDGKIPEGWDLPELKDRVEIKDNCVFADLTGLSAPTPMVGTLKILEQLSTEQHFEGLYPHSPIQLFPHLNENGWSWEVLEKTPKGVTLKIFKESKTA